MEAEGCILCHQCERICPDAAIGWKPHGEVAIKGQQKQRMLEKTSPKLEGSAATRTLFLTPVLGLHGTILS